MIKPNALFNADCIEVLQRMEAHSIDLVYLDPPLPTLTGAHDTSSDPSQNHSWHQHMQFIAKVCQHLHRVLKSTGVIFFHAQPSSTFSIRLILNQVFGEAFFRNEIVWNEKYQLASKGRIGSQHDSILQYGKSSMSTDNAVFRPVSRAEIRTRFPKSDARGAFALADLTVTLCRHALQFEWTALCRRKGARGDLT
jgi:DNA modification methylase